MDTFQNITKKFPESIIKKIENEDKLWEYVNNQRDYIPYLPPRITFITSKRCNLSCRFCYHFRHKYMHNISPLNMPVMDKKLIYKVAEEIFPTLQYYETTLLGDPFLSPTLDIELELASKYGVYMRPTTNGTTVTDKNIDKVSGHMDWLKCSFDSHIRGVYNSIRIGARFENTIKKLKNFVKRREEMDPMPYFRMGLVLNDLNVEEIPDYFLWCHEYMGVDDVEIMGLNVDADHIESLSVFDKAKIVNKSLDKVIDLALTKKYRLRLDFTQMPEPNGDRFVCQKRSKELREQQRQYGFVPPKNFEKMSYVIQNPRNRWEICDIGYVWSNNMRDDKVCIEFMNRPFILDNGNVEVCGNCNTFKAGNLKYQNFSEVWNSKMYKYIRRAMYDGTIKKDWPDACNDCICMGVTYDRGRSDHRHKPFYRVIEITDDNKEIRTDVGSTHGNVDFPDKYETKKYIKRVEEFSGYPRILPETSGKYLSDFHDEDCKKQPGIGYDKMNTFTPLVMDGNIYTKGLYCEAPSEITFFLDSKYESFKAIIGLYDNTNSSRHILDDYPGQIGCVEFIISGDGNEIFHSTPKTCMDKGEYISLNIKGVKKLTLLTQICEGIKIAPWSIWADAKVE